MSESRASLPGPGSRGLTLIELVIVVALLGILIVMAVPSYKDFRQNSYISAAVNELVAHISTARKEAMSRSAQVVLCRTAFIDEDNPEDSTCSGAANRAWTTGWLVYSIANGSSPGTFQDVGQDLLAVRTGFTDGTTITSNANGNAWLAINPDGTLDTAGPAVYAVCDDRLEDDGKLVVVNMTGRTRVTNTTSATATDCTPT